MGWGVDVVPIYIEHPFREAELVITQFSISPMTLCQQLPHFLSPYLFILATITDRCSLDNWLRGQRQDNRVGRSGKSGNFGG